MSDTRQDEKEKIWSLIKDARVAIFDQRARRPALQPPHGCVAEGL